jgi:hypothetical protein
MGFSQSWVAVKGKPRAAVLGAFGLHGTGKREEIAESPIVGADLPRGWFLIVTDRACHRFLDDRVLERLSAGCEVVAGYVEEHVMVSTSAGWKVGQRTWSLTHDGQIDIEHLEAKGDLPSVFAGIRDGLRFDQQIAGGRHAQVDYLFEVPVMLAESLTGYRYNADFPERAERPFEVLVETSVSRSLGGTGPSFWKRLFGS